MLKWHAAKQSKHNQTRLFGHEAYQLWRESNCAGTMARFLYCAARRSSTQTSLLDKPYIQQFRGSSTTPKPSVFETKRMTRFSLCNTSIHTTLCSKMKQQMAWKRSLQPALRHYYKCFCNFHAAKKKKNLATSLWRLVLVTVQKHSIHIWKQNKIQGTDGVCIHHYKTKVTVWCDVHCFINEEKMVTGKISSSQRECCFVLWVPQLCCHAIHKQWKKT